MYVEWRGKEWSEMCQCQCQCQWVISAYEQRGRSDIRIEHARLRRGRVAAGLHFSRLR